MKKILILLLLAAFWGTGCKKSMRQNDLPSPNEAASFRAISSLAINETPPLSLAALKELSDARKASAKFHSIDVALDAGYVDINFVVPNMGHHFMNASMVDDHFDPEKPEILVYQKSDITGRYKLVAVEYAYDNGDYQNPPEGFNGSNDDWHLFTPSGPWLLHAWVWANNPAGIFNPTNPSVP